MLVGYARLSRTDKEAGLAAQIRDLQAVGCDKIFPERISAVAQSRPVLIEALASLQPGDTLVVTKPDRMARSTTELLTIEADLTKRGIGLIILSISGMKLDTRNPTSKFILTILAGVATWEREMMLERQREGIAKAKEDGKYVGRKPTVSVWHAESIRRLLAQGHNGPEIAKMVDVSKRTVYRVRDALQSDASPQAAAISAATTGGVDQVAAYQG